MTNSKWRLWGRTTPSKLGMTRGRQSRKAHQKCVGSSHSRPSPPVSVNTQHPSGSLASCFLTQVMALTLWWLARGARSCPPHYCHHQWREHRQTTTDFCSDCCHGHLSAPRLIPQVRLHQWMLPHELPDASTHPFCHLLNGLPETSLLASGFSNGPSQQTPLRKGGY